MCPMASKPATRLLQDPCGTRELAKRPLWDCRFDSEVFLESETVIMFLRNFQIKR